MGPSGSGKSTLLHVAGGLERPAQGRVLIAGQDITHASEAALTRLRQTTVGFVFQNFNLIGSLSAEQNVAMPLRLAGRRPTRREVRDVLERVGLADRARHRPRELSGGQQQRVAIARAMVTRPTVLLADEPTGALDSRAARTILAMLRTMAEEGQTIVMVTHDPLAAASADEVMFLTDGHVVDRVARPSAREVADRLARMEDPHSTASSVSSMIRLSWATFRERWPLFVGAIVAVAVGVALVQASLLTLISAATPSIPTGLPHDQELLLRDGYTGAVSLAGMMTGISAFVAVFIVASTFAFTVAQRRRDLALLRLIGARRRQVRRLMFGEALVLGTLGSSAGILLGVLIAPVEVRLLARPGLVPADFHAEWRSWIVAVSLAVGIGISVAGSFGAARRAARVRPLDGLHAVSGDRVMTVSRWAIGLIASAGVVAMIAAATSMGGTGAMNMSIGIALVAVIALSALSPTVVPLVNRLVRVFSRLLFPRSKLS